MEQNNLAKKPVALITGVSRKIGIGAEIAAQLAAIGYNIAITYWQPYDKLMEWGSNPADIDTIIEQVTKNGAKVIAIESDLCDTQSPGKIFDNVENQLGPVTALIINHCYSIDSDILTTTIEAFDKHFAINARATWLLVQQFAQRYKSGFGQGRIVSITSDHTAFNLPYGASKGAMDRIVLAAAYEFRTKGITANVVNPGATDTGWMTSELKTVIKNKTFLNSVGMPYNCANLVAFLCSDKGGWINGQLLYSNGGIE